MSVDNVFAPPGEPTQPRSSQGRVELRFMDIVKRWWAVLTESPGLVFAAAVIISLPGWLVMAIQWLFLGGRPDPSDFPAEGAGGLPLMIGLVIAQTTLTLGGVRLFLHLARGQPGDLSLLWGEGRYLLKAIVMYVGYSFVLCLGFAILFVPGIMLLIGLQFAYFVMLDRDFGPLDALNESWALTSGHKWALLRIGFVPACAVLAVSLAVAPLGNAAGTLFLLFQAVLYDAIVGTSPPRS
jgi:hypothetical protein